MAVVLLIAVAMLRVAATYRVFSQTSDEPVHIAAGLRYLQFGDCGFDIEHPPLARAVAAIPFVRMPPPRGGWIAQGNAILNWRGDYLGNLVRARIGNLLFLAIAMIAVALWTRRAFGDAAAICATAMMALLPPLLGHAGLATTDMAVAAMLPAALYAMLRWMDAPSWPRAIVMGFVIGFGLLSKYSFLVFFPLGVLVLIAVRRKRLAANGVAALAIAFLVVWGAYSFAFESPRRAFPQGAEMAFHAYQGPLRELVPESIADVPIPAPLYALGILEVKFHNDRGHEDFLLGHTSHFGWWYYFPVVLFFKTPIAFLLLAAYGAAIAWRRARELALLPLAVLAPAMTSSIDIGVRHILPIYPLLAILAGAGAVAMWRAPHPPLRGTLSPTRGTTGNGVRPPLLPAGEENVASSASLTAGSGRMSGWRVVAVALSAWLLIGTTLAHPDYLAWFNEAAGRHPERIVVDSNLDWGQDVLRLAAVCRERHIDRIGLALFSTADFDRIGLPPHTIATPASPPHGWLAVSEILFRMQPWRVLDRVPYERVGKSIRLYRLR